MERNKLGQFLKGHKEGVGRRLSDMAKKKISVANSGKIAWNRNFVIKKCPICGKEYKVIKYLRLRGWGKTCSVSCRNRFRPDIYAKSGKYASAYKNGISIYRKLINKEKCNECGSTKHLLVHHKDENRENNIVDNLEVLCKRCHQILHGCINIITDYNSYKIRKSKKKWYN